LSRAHGSVLIASKQNTFDFAVLASNDATGSVNSGVYTNAAFTGSIITIPHTLNINPTAVTVTPGNSGSSNVLGSPYYITRNATDIFINLSVTVVVPISITIFWTVTRN
jgi:hypothetical protein